MRTRLYCIVTIFLCLITVMGCDRTPEEIKQEINRLEKRESELYFLNETQLMRAQELDTEVSRKEALVRELDARLAIEGEPLYILTLHVQKNSLTLSLTQMAQDQENSFDFDIAVDKDLYGTVEVGQDLTSAFMGGSFLFGGHLGSVNVTVTKKRLEQRQP